MNSEPLRLSFKLSFHGDTGSSELEKILTDTEAPYFKRIRSASWLELKLLSHLAAPAVIVYLLNNVVSMSTQIFCGHLGNLELAAVSLGNTGIQMFAYGLMGIWSGLLGGTLLQTIILLWVTLRTDWNKEVEVATSRLSAWDEKRQPLLLE
ncbi:unnamed protein product [Dovyalis caffra]|uniref:Uncharacterized protein n=1 Tax=Dovyalis caffra TaxID=77055 RepID=A0AAV1SHN2_9ROSI|nr:unnamed protein product [Dovyalis caffra]